jgi:hypothetical protein
MIKRHFSGLKRLLAAAGAAVLLSAGTAQADFRGGGAVFGFTDSCAAGGWPVGSMMPVRIRHSASEDNPGGAPPSQITLAFPTLTEHYSLWGAFTPSPSFFGAAGRQVGSFFVFYPQRPLIRVVQRAVTERMNPSGPVTVQNARELILRLRIQNFGNLSGCAATVTASLRRFN